MPNDDNDRAGWLPPRPFSNGHHLVLLRPDSIRFSQNTVSGPTWFNGVQIPLPDLPEAITVDGRYAGAPIDVVPMPDGRLTSLDNRRLWAAQRAGLPQIAAIMHGPEAPFTSHEQRKHMELRRALVDKQGALGSPGARLFDRGREPTTMFEAALFRCSKQGRLRSGEPFPLLGTLEEPRYTGEKQTHPSPNATKGGTEQTQARENRVTQSARVRDLLITELSAQSWRLRGRGRQGGLER